MTTTEGLAKVNELVKKEYLYLGGERNPSNPAPFNQWTRWCETRLIPKNPNILPAKHKDKCLCGHDIEFNCWVYKIKPNGDISIKVVGSHCIDKFVQHRQVCQDCNEPHRNKKLDLCTPCKKQRERNKNRPTHCQTCYTRINLSEGQRFKQCYSCYHS
tara:strand:+ start:432 stop:905 length:474 start_codon:yes stop_codon:yes gene_type:complete